ncbi:MAG: PIN domain-containing protein [Caldilineaceae bacterium]|nr:PIN domain-containing protein [Caldilineaceae bacterium]
MGFLIDSAVLIAVERERISLDKITADLTDHPLAMSAITASELLHGVHRAKEAPIRHKRANFVDYLLGLFPVIPVDLEVARIHAVLWAGLAERGEQIGAHDLLIAATARSLNYGVVTFYVREFERIPNLTIYNPAAS